VLQVLSLLVKFLYRLLLCHVSYGTDEDMGVLEIGGDIDSAN